MPIRLVGTPANGNAANGGDVTLTFTVAPQQDDVVYVAGGHFARAGLGPSTSGYTAVATDTSTNCNFGLWRKVMGSTPDTTVVCQGGANASDGVAYIAYVFRGVDTTTPEDATATKTVATQVGNSPSITTVTDSAIVLSVTGSLITPTASVNAPTGYGAFQFASNADTNGFEVLGACKYVPQAGTAEDPAAFTVTSGINVSISCAIRPAASDTSLLFRMLNAAAPGDAGAVSAHANASHNAVPPTSGAGSTAWTVSKTAASNFSALQFGVNRAAATFGATTLTGALGTSNAYRSESPLNGTFATGTWIATFVLGAAAALTGAGRMRCRFWKSTDPTGASATDLSGSGGITGNITGGVFGATTRLNFNAKSLVSWAPGSTVTLTNEYLFVQCEWEITTASGSNGDTFYIANDIGCTVSTPAFTHATAASVIDTATLAVNEPNRQGFNVRQVFIDSILPTVTQTGSIQLTIKTDSLTSAGQIDSCYVGQGQFDGYGGDLYDFATTPVQVTFNTGSATRALSGAETILTDAVAYTHDPTKNLIVALHFSGTRVDGLKNTGVGGAIEYVKSAADEGSTLGVSGYTATANQLSFVSKIEMISAALSVAATFQGAGALTASVRQILSARATLAGAGALTAAARQIMVAKATFAGAGSVTAVATVVSPAASAFQTDAFQNDAFQLTAGGPTVHSAAATFVGAGSLTAAVQLRMAAAATLQGAGVLAASVTQRVAVAATFQGAGALTANATILGATVAHQIAANFAGAGALTANVVLRAAVAATLQGAGNLTAAVNLRMAAAATLAGTGALTAAVNLRMPIAATLAGTGALTAALTQRLNARATLAGAGALTANVTLAAVVWQVTARLAGSGSFGNNPAAWWNFVNVGVDASGHGHDGTLHGTSLTTDPYGRPARLFNGTTDYIDGSTSPLEP